MRPIPVSRSRPATGKHPFGRDSGATHSGRRCLNGLKDGLGRGLRLVVNAKTRQEEVKAMTRDQLSVFLGAARNAPTAYERRHYPLFLVLGRTGMRLGEGLALQWDDVHFAEKEIRVARALSGGRIEKPKSGHGRTVDMSEQLARVLLRLQVQRKTETLKRGWSKTPEWVFCTEAGTLRTLRKGCVGSSLVSS